MIVHLLMGFSKTYCAMQRTGQIVTDEESRVTCRSCIVAFKRLDAHAKRTMKRNEQPKRNILGNSQPVHVVSPMTPRGTQARRPR